MRGKPVTAGGRALQQVEATEWGFFFAHVVARREEAIVRNVTRRLLRESVDAEEQTIDSILGNPHFPLSQISREAGSREGLREKVRTIFPGGVEL